jgi:pimeloyl-ACP methyl ester carboxylesterase
MEQVTSKDGTVISYRRSGTGPPLLLVHGTTADHRRWTAISPRFEQQFSVYALDRRGRGGSGDGPEYAIPREAEDIAAVIEAIGEPVFVLAHSYGAVCSLEAALLTGRIKRLILYEPPVPTGIEMYPPGLPDRIQALVDRGELETALEMFFREIVRMPEPELKSYRSLPMWPARVQLAPTIPREMTIDRHYPFDAGKFSDFQTPTLLLLGGDSPPMFSQAIEVVAAALPNARVVILPGQRHIAMDTNQDLFVKEVMAFLS